MGKLYAYLAVALGAVLLVGFAARSLYTTGRDAGRALCEADHTKAAETARAEEARREAASAKAGTSMLEYLAANIPPVEIRTHETVEVVRTLYRDRPVPVGCVWPDGVHDELEAARQRANAAASRL